MPDPERPPSRLQAAPPEPPPPRSRDSPTLRKSSAAAHQPAPGPSAPARRGGSHAVRAGSAQALLGDEPDPAVGFARFPGKGTDRELGAVGSPVNPRAHPSPRLCQPSETRMAWLQAASEYAASLLDSPQMWSHREDAETGPEGDRRLATLLRAESPLRPPRYVQDTREHLRTVNRRRHPRLDVGTTRMTGCEMPRCRHRGGYEVPRSGHWCLDLGTPEGQGA